MQAYKKSLMELRKCMMQIEMNVNSRDNFLLDESEHEITQNLFIKALSTVDQIIMSIKNSTVDKSRSRSKINESSTNKSNSDWETKTVSNDKTLDIDSKCIIKEEIGLIKKSDLEMTGNIDLSDFALNQKSISSINKSQTRKQNSEYQSLTYRDKSINLFDAEKEYKTERKEVQSSESQDYLNIIHCQAQHLENLILYIEDMNVEFDKIRS